jgi:16S rRNA (guanine527-N7)-methyltransferase
MLFNVDPRSLIEAGLGYFSIESDEETLAGLTGFILELNKWNRRMNLTGFKDVESMVKELMFDAFFLYGHVKASRSLLDLGSGAGVLGIPLSLLNRKMHVFSLDKSLRKIQFQRHIKRTMNLGDFEPVQGRVEDLKPLEVESLVVKAFGSTRRILELGGRHLSEGGTAFILKGKKEGREDFAGFEAIRAIPYTLPMGEKSYRLIIYRKVE